MKGPGDAFHEAPIRPRRRVRIARLPRSTERNPYQAMLYRALSPEGIDLMGDGSLRLGWLARQRGSVDLLHFHWRFDRLVGRPTRVEMDRGPSDRSKVAQMMAVLSVALRLAVARSLGYRMAWTVHDVANFGHGGSLFDRGVARCLARSADVVLAHSGAAARYLDEELALGRDVVVTPLPHYGDAHREPSPGDRTGVESALRAELALGPETRVFLAFGTIRADKDLDLLTSAFTALPIRDAALVVTGDAYDAPTLEGLRRAAAIDPRIRLRPRHVPDDQVRALFGLADVAVVARSREWTPSSLVLALSLGVPVVAADLATNREAIGPGGWLFEPGDREALVDALVESTDSAEAARRAHLGRCWVLDRTWEETARLTAKAIREGVSTRRRGSLRTML